ncbi:helix-turn-helix domain-containing protein [Sulfitobacter sp. 20_GPM-1509m]|uniref:helix-turn-helix domain-containing protein n=1 Tax=Sulfitobacter sp. 20_GPM-1509m TaxID=1380367 RepID=UPI000683E94D|nr:helix-turn-helix domain-containing protein [Sulfitobacter sp. 20_GPM-1509m]
MTQLIAIDATALDALLSEIARLHQRFDAVEMTPRPEWVTIPDAAEALGVSTDTIRRYIRQGSMEARDVCGRRMVPNPAV